MGAVYRARDALTGGHVALKLLHAATSPEVLYRFHREAVLLGELRHPAIVSYLAHGTTQGGQPFLAMEWLEGEDLAQRLTRGPLSLPETLALLRRAAEGLAQAHQQGIVHRDLKPSNLFLRHGHPEDVVLLDFGLARYVQPSLLRVTASQMVLGTPGYMAPEQASSQPDLTSSADLFSLGCVLYECLTGQPPFAAPHFVAALAKILFTEPTPLRELRPELPVAVQDLVNRMLAKEPGRRLPDAASLLEALSALESRSEPLPPPPTRDERPPRLAAAEQQLVSILLVSLRSESLHEQEASANRGLLLRDALHTELAPYGAQVELLADGSLVATLRPERGTATDLAALTARCALLFKERWPEASVVLSTGPGVLSERLPVGEVMDRAGRLLCQSEQTPDSSAQVMLDEVTAGLLGPGFQLSRSHSGTFLLHGEHLDADESRPLLGRPTSCVGREQELALLHMAFTTCVEESTAQALLVTAPAGVGKSRLRHEFLRRMERHEPPPLVLLGRGDPMKAGSADGLLAQALRRLCDIAGGEPLEERRARLSQRLSQHLPAVRAQEVVEFLGELCAIPFPDEHSPRLRVARADPQMMSTQVGRALVAWVKAECAHHPVLLVLEDLHWGDMLSVRLMDEALRELSEQPFMVLALARPEVEPLLPGPWVQRLQPIPLRGLSRKASARLVHEMLGADVPGPLVDKLVEQAAGNALFLEELIRAVMEGRGETPPETVLAMLQARLGRLEPEARQVLLAASLFGRTFWAGGVRALLGGESTAETLKNRLQPLVEQEWVAPQPDSRFPGEAEYCFRHALVRDAAYALVPDSHKPDGHRRVGAWLEQAGENDPRVLAEHASLGQQSERAIHLLTRAAEQLFEHGDMPGTLRCVEAALALGVQGAELVQLRALQATVAFWVGDFTKLFEIGPGVLTRLRPGSRLWSWLVCGLCLGHGLSGRQEQAAALGQELLRTPPDAVAQMLHLEALCAMACVSAYGGARQESSVFVARLVELCAESAPEAPLERAWSHFTQGFFSLFFEARPWQACVWLEQGYRGFFDVGLERNALGSQAVWAHALAALGDFASAEAGFRKHMALAQQLRLNFPILYSRLHLALLLAGSADPFQREEALALANDQDAKGPGLFSGLTHLLKAKVAENGGDLAEAEARARAACELLAPFPTHQRMAQTLLTRVLLAQGRASEAREVAVLGVQRLEQCGSGGAEAVGLRLALAEACLAEGDTQAGEAALRRALQCVRTRAEDIPNAAARERFLHRVPENARTLALARQRWDEAW
jgi:tetratricopeptide (TPR) repeat protein